jgi:hypothetical protein
MLSSRTKAAAVAVATLAGSVAFAIGLATTPASGDAAVAATCGVLFDDFTYSSSSDPNIASRGWTVRTNAGGPGVPGASWPASNVTFPTVTGGRVMQLSASTDGTAGGTSHAEMFHQRKFFEGTYAARVRFTDAPVSGSDGDHLVETFFTITPLNAPLDPSYGELDFEYLPNGGWGEPSNIFYQTTWETYQNEPWIADNIHTEQRRSFDGWHDLLIQVRNGRVKYFVDGVQFADHGDKYYPETPMSINFNLWFIDLTAHTGGRSTYQQQVDWLYFVDTAVLSPADVSSRVAAYRSGGTAHTDTVNTGGTCPTGGPTPTPPRTTPPGTPTPTPPRTTPPPTSGPGCAGVPAWNWGTVYLEGQRVRHNNRLWRARWWTQGSEPGLTAQWQDLGPC